VKKPKKNGWNLFQRVENGGSVDRGKGKVKNRKGGNLRLSTKLEQQRKRSSVEGGLREQKAKEKH